MITTPFIRPENLTKVLVLYKSPLIKCEYPSRRQQNRTTQWKSGWKSLGLSGGNCGWRRLCNNKEVRYITRIQRQKLLLQSLFSRDCYCDDRPEVYRLDERNYQYQSSTLGKEISQSPMETFLYFEFSRYKCNPISEKHPPIFPNQETSIGDFNEVSDWRPQKVAKIKKRQSLLGNERSQSSIQTPAETERGDLEAFKFKEATVRTTPNDKWVEWSRNDFTTFN